STVWRGNPSRASPNSSSRCSLAIDGLLSLHARRGLPRQNGAGKAQTQAFGIASHGPVPKRMEYLELSQALAVAHAVGELHLGPGLQHVDRARRSVGAARRVRFYEPQLAEHLHA